MRSLIAQTTVGFAVPYSPSASASSWEHDRERHRGKEATHRTLVNDQHGASRGSLLSCAPAVGMKTGYAGIGQPTRALESTGNPYSDASMRRAARACMSTATTSPLARAKCVVAQGSQTCIQLRERRNMEQRIKGQAPCLLDRAGPYFNQLCRRCGLRRSSESKVRYSLCPEEEDLAGSAPRRSAPITDCN